MNLRSLARRALLITGIILGVTSVVYLEGGLIDNRSGEPPGFWDSLYFSIITITTVGYGDIVPIYTMSRLLDALVLTPIRFIFFFLIFDTAYEFALRRFQEEHRMKKLSQRLDQHTIICGFGASGASAANELLLQGVGKQDIVVLDCAAEALEEAAELGVTCVQGDATREHVLRSVAVSRAASVLVAPGRDDTAVLITLTVRALNPQALVVAMCAETENIKLLERAGAHHIVNPAFAGGSLMAAATRQVYLAETLKEILSVGGSLRLDQRPVRADEVGKRPSELKDTLTVRVYRNGACFDTPDFPELQANDTLVYLARQRKDGDPGQGSPNRITPNRE